MERLEITPLSKDSDLWSIDYVRPNLWAQNQFRSTYRNLPL